MVDIVTVVGARPQFIKCAPVSRVLREKFYEYIIHTGQHYDQDMSSVFFQELGIPEPDINLQVGSGAHGEQTGKMLIGIEEILLKQNPQLVLVYGDTNSTLAGALAAAKLHIPVAHVEAGLRSYDRSMPEEINRVVTDHLSTLLFCPTNQAVENLAKEGISQNVMNTGDVMVDALLMIRSGISFEDSLLKNHGVKPGKYFLATIHRPVNTDSIERLGNIFSGLDTLPFPVVLPLHPRTKNLMKVSGIDGKKFQNIRFISPQSYRSMVCFMSGANTIITDSGGIQKEAYILKVPCVTLRNTTEWIETVQDGWNILVDADIEALHTAVDYFSTTVQDVHYMRYGDGSASQNIVQQIVKLMKNT